MSNDIEFVVVSGLQILGRYRDAERALIVAEICQRHEDNTGNLSEVQIVDAENLEEYLKTQRT